MRVDELEQDLGASTERSRRVGLGTRAVAATIAALDVLLVGLNILLGMQEELIGEENAWAFLSVFDLGNENNVAAWFSSALLLTAAALLALIWATRRPGEPRRAWLALALLFVLLSADETAAMHERLIEPLQRGLDTGGTAFHYAWVIPGIAFVVVVAALCLPFLRRLPPVTRNGFLLGGALFVAGAIGLEMAMGVLLEEVGQGFLTGVTALGEETLELLGVTVFIATLLHHLERHSPRIELVVRR